MAYEKMEEREPAILAFLLEAELKRGDNDILEFEQKGISFLIDKFGK